ncbi:6-phosphogluconolactonase [bacterium BMS3Abin09]|nr:6-phosphogluconolactonase [bacterium BMS3Abin09]GBE41471.1 6-phosphogluconolactonase [bacterium BMS3Bbin09]HDH34131.1 6-phosphogluconolactonase [Nitrospirota bacterium]
MADMVNKQIIIFKDIDDITDYVVRKWTEIAEKTVNEKGFFSVAISGGKTPATLFQKLAKEKKLPWNRTHVFMVDERFVPYQDEHNNYRMINELLLRHVNIPAKNIHPISTIVESPQASALKYEKELNSFFRSRPGFDLVLLGIGEDGHTASLFPRTPSLKEKKHSAIAVPPSGTIMSERITMTFPVIDNAENIMFMAEGPGKSGVIREVIENEKSRLPAALVRPGEGSLFYLLDEAAASLLSKK